MSTEWFGTLPPHGNWRAVRLKRLVKWWTIKKEYEEGETYIGLENIEPWTGRIIPSEDGTLTLTTSGETTSIGAFFKPGDVLFSKLRPYLAKAFLADREGLCSTELLVLEPGPDICGRFLLYVLLTPSFIDLVNSSTFGSKMPRAEWDFIGDIPIPLPPLRQQQHIAELLDLETVRLDQLVAAKQTQLELIAEKRRALITRAVTQGLDVAAPRRATWLPWLREVPAGWEVFKISHLFESSSGTTPKADELSYYEGAIPWVTTSELRENIITSTSKQVTALAMADYSALKLHPVGSLVIAMYGATIGRVGILGIEATVNQACCVLLPSRQCLVGFAFYWFQSARDLLNVLAVGGGQPNLSQEIITSLHLGLPPLDEQAAIVSYIEAELKKLDDLYETTEDSLKLMQERRAALLTAAVTGELDVTTA
ncbi:MAG TPA: restriction endonuclease subunit S [Hymenobacter sp.]|uniref:restriction endonuclease subunit S n=1 Tax=Hymenobacter sp. TaxID=1898978 RepID=UPI002D80B5A4|nr:restriction endonuclease subunit S [Hymenobacter sp.]HET9505367.1 restriction endonuclease subunit S [Hymenobacter sp.]